MSSELKCPIPERILHREITLPSLVQESKSDEVQQLRCETWESQYEFGGFLEMAYIQSSVCRSVPGMIRRDQTVGAEADSSRRCEQPML